MRSVRCDQGYGSSALSSSCGFGLGHPQAAVWHGTAVLQLSGESRLLYWMPCTSVDPLITVEPLIKCELVFCDQIPLL